MNIRLDIEYDGTHFFGWQRQGNLPTIQGYLEDALQRINGHRTVLYGASRTDAGVHAFGQVANFFSSQPSITPSQWPFLLNSKLPKEIRIQGAHDVSKEFHAQKNARSKVYEYWIWNAPLESAFMTRAYFCPLPIKWVKIEESTCEFIGTHDFLPFQSGKNERVSTVRTLHSFQVIRPKEPAGLYRIQVEGNGFLKHMVRNIVGALLGIGLGSLKRNEISEILAGKKLNSRFRTLPAMGLHLIKVNYAQ